MEDIEDIEDINEGGLAVRVVSCLSLFIRPLIAPPKNTARDGKLRRRQQQ